MDAHPAIIFRLISQHIFINTQRNGKAPQTKKTGPRDRVATIPPVNGTREPTHEKRGHFTSVFNSRPPFPGTAASPRTPGVPSHGGPFPDRSRPHLRSAVPTHTAQASTRQLPWGAGQPAVPTPFISTPPLRHRNQTCPPLSCSEDCEPFKDEPSVSISPAPQHAARDCGRRVF